MNSEQTSDDKILVVLDILEYYDQKIKSYVKKKIKESGGSATANNIKFYDSFGQLPEIGQKEVLYITKDSIYQWNNSTGKYEQLISSSSGGSESTDLLWGKF